MVPLARISDIPEGQMRAFQVDGVGVLVCQVEGQFYAVANRCSHASQELAGGDLKGFELVCPLHRARFDVRSGKACSAPATAPIKTFPVRIEGGKVHVQVSAADAPPKPKFGPLM